MSKKRVLVAHGDMPEEAVDMLKYKYDTIVMKKNWPDEQEVLKLLPDYDALLGKIHIDAKFLDAAGTRLKVISTPSAGYDHLDVKEIKKRGIKVGNAPEVLSAAVAETAIFLLLGASKRAHELRTLQGQGKIENGFQWCLGQDLKGGVVGIVGLGNIGTQIAKRLNSFEVKKFLYTAHSPKKISDGFTAEFATLDQLLQQSDFVINCLPLNPETSKMFNEEKFNMMKNNSVFVNIGRGGTVDTPALVNALKKKVIFAAGLDVTDPEPLPVDHELLTLPNAFLTPHIGSQTVATRIDMAKAAAQNIINGLDGKPLLYEL